MTKYMLGTKGRMTQVFDEGGAVHAATVVLAGPLTVTQVKTSEKDAYEAVQVGFGAMKESRVAKPQKSKPFGALREFPSSAEGGSASGGKLEAGASVDISIFAPGDLVCRLLLVKSTYTSITFTCTDGYYESF